ncbi:fos-related antigen 1-like [Tubulanus polymorphus]|uniref:fos-related antigen 1-like n=1 Tax=Tubulanus polymorphus TaxID=672921 RepID=UPI003DA51283
MYSSQSNHQEMSDSKYTVADILSSMASGVDPSPTAYTAASYVSGITSLTTPTLTPTTLSNIEQTFLELQSGQNLQDRHMQSGFVPPHVEPHGVKRELKKDDPDWFPSSSTSSTSSTPAKKFKGRDLLREEDIYTPGYLSTSRRPPKRQKDDDLQGLPVEEKERRLQRRERNKLAAAKCRQRRVDHTNQLVQETEALESEKSDLENEIQGLQQQKEQLEFLLQAHKPLCKITSQTVSGVTIKRENADESSLCSGNINTRPMSLPLQKTNNAGDLGVPISTPSNGIFSFGLDSIVDGHTGLTPLITTSCAGQLTKNSEHISSDPLNSPTLISL